MNWMRMYRLESALAASLLSLVLQLVWPSLVRAWNLPRAGSAGIAYLDDDVPAGIDAAYLAYLPDGYQSTSDRWPLVVYLHGSGDTNKREFLRRDIGPMGAECLHDLPAIIVAPTCVGRGGWAPDAVAAFLDRVISEYSVDESRIYLVGYSMGGFGTWSTAAQYPERFAAVVPLAGGGDPATAAKLTGLPIWAFHGEQDRVVRPSGTREMIAAVEAAGGSPKVTYYPRAGHGITSETFSSVELWDWLLEQRRSRSPL